MIIENVRHIRSRMYTAAIRAGRDPNEVSLLAVTKYAPLEAVKELLASGEIQEAAESRVQDAQRRKAELGALAGKVRWRLIGHLQTNKAKQAVEAFDAIDSIDSLKVALELEKRLEAAGKEMEGLLQIKVTSSPSQSGVRPEDARDVMKELDKLRRLRINGLMSIAPEAPELVRPAFKTVAQIFRQVFAGRNGARLSLGMSTDFETAIEEGSTMVRIGSALFGPAVHSESSNMGGQ